MTRIDKGEVIELDEIIAQDKMNKNVLEFMQEMKRDQGYTFHDSSESEDDNITSVNQDTHLDEKSDAGGRLKVPRINVNKTDKITDRRASNYSSRSKTSR